MGLAKHDDMSVHSRRMDPINLSATPSPGRSGRYPLVTDAHGS
jgi:hypothetical protein